MTLKAPSIPYLRLSLLHALSLHVKNSHYLLLAVLSDAICSAAYLLNEEYPSLKIWTKPRGMLSPSETVQNLFL